MLYLFELSSGNGFFYWYHRSYPIIRKCSLSQVTVDGFFASFSEKEVNYCSNTVVLSETQALILTCNLTPSLILMVSDQKEPRIPKKNHLICLN